MTFTPIFSVTDRTEASIRRIERNAWLIEHGLLMPRHEQWIRREVNVARASGTTRIEGAEMEPPAVAELLRHEQVTSLTADERDNLNAIRAYEFIDYLSDQADLPINELAIREMNRLFIAGAPETLTPGAYRRGQNTVGDRYRPPDQGDVPALMSAFGEWLQRADDVHPVLRAGLAHIEFVAIHPFWDGNGRTGRGLAALVLQRSPYHFRKLLSFEEVMARNVKEYFTQIEMALGREYAAGYDATRWLEYFAGVVLEQAEALVDLLTEWQRQFERMHQLGDSRGLSFRQVEALIYAASAGKMTRQDYMEISNVSAETASRDLAKLLRLGLVTAHGNTRSRYYVLVPETLDKE